MKSKGLRMSLKESSLIHVLHHEDSATSMEIMDKLRLGIGAPCSKELMDIVMRDKSLKVKTCFLMNWKNRNTKVSEEEVFQWLDWTDDNAIRGQILQYWAHIMPSYEIHRLVASKSSNYDLILGVLRNKDLKILRASLAKK